MEKKIDELLKNVDKINKKIDENAEYMKRKFKENKDRIQIIVENQNKLISDIEKLEEKNKLKDKEISLLKGRIDDLERAALDSTLVLYPIPKLNGENLSAVVNKVLEKAGGEVKEGDIISTYRRNERKNGKPGDVVIKCVSKDKRNNFIEGIKRVKLTSNDIGITEGTGRIYANEEVTKLVKDIYYGTLRMKHEKGWKYVWIRNGRVFLRKTEGGEILKIDSLDTLSA